MTYGVCSEDEEDADKIPDNKMDILAGDLGRLIIDPWQAKDPWPKTAPLKIDIMSDATKKFNEKLAEIKSAMTIIDKNSDTVPHAKAHQGFLEERDAPKVEQKDEPKAESEQFGN